MEIFQVTTGFIIAAGTALGALALIFKFFRNPIRRWLGVGQTSPGEVKTTVEEGLQIVLSNQIIITDNQQLILGIPRRVCW